MRARTAAVGLEASESEFQSWVTRTFQEYGWTVKHAATPMRPVRGGKFVPDGRGRGMLDLQITHPDPPRLILAECKKHGGVLSPEQREVLRALRAVAAEVVELRRDAIEYAATPPGPTPFAVFVFEPGCEALVEAIARGAAVSS